MRLFRLVTKCLTSFIKGGKGFLLRKLNYERIIDSFGSCDYECRFQYIVRYAARLFPTRSLVLGGFIWVFASPLVLRAEYELVDRNYLSDIHQDTDWIRTYSDEIQTNTAAIKGYLESRFTNWMGYSFLSGLPKRDSSISMDMGMIIDNLNASNASSTNIVAKLDVIISYLEQLSEDESSGSSSTNTVAITQDWLKEDTFKESFGGFVEKYDSFLASWGFSGGSSGETLKSFLYDNFVFNSNKKFTGVYRDYARRRLAQEPFPGSINGYWLDMTTYTDKSISFNTPFEYLGIVISDGFADVASSNMNNLRKQSYNDWQAHTNLIEKLDSIYRLDSKSDLEYNAETGEVTLTQTGTGSSSESSEVIEVTPVSTNTVDTAITSITETEVVVTEFFDKEVIQTRYINSSLLEVGQDYGIGESVGSNSSGVLVTEWFTIDFSVWGESYRRYLTQERLRSWREIAGYLWTLASVVLCVILVRKWGNM